MRRISAIAVVGILTLTMAGCGSANDQASTSSPPAPEQTAPQAVKTQPAPKPFEKPPVVPQTSTVKTSSASGLIQATNGNQRAKQVEKGRKDPFAGLFAPVVVAKAPTTAPPAPKPQNTQNTAPSLPKPPAIPRSPKPVVVAPPQPVAVAPPPAPLPSVAPAPPVEPVLPPQPEVAKGITVTGVVQIGNELQAIVQVPSEGTSRYVREGQQLSNGQVLVKRIEVNQGAQPIVILEEKGIEVAKAIGAPPDNPEQQNSRTSASQPSSSDNNNTPTPTITSPSPPSNTNTPTTNPSSLPARNRNAPPRNVPSPPQNRINPPTITTPSPAPSPNNNNDSDDER